MSDMAIGPIQSVDPLRKFRWTLTVDGINENFIKTSARPNFSFEATTIEHLHEKVYIAGKITYQTIPITVIDVASDTALISWLAAIFGGVVDRNLATMGFIAAYKRDATIRMYSPIGTVEQAWTLKGAWPMESNFQDLDYANSETADVDVTLRYDKAFQTTVT